MSDAIICAPMRIEARAIRRGLRTSADPPEILRTGYGTTRAADRAGELKASPFGQMVVMGVGAGLTDDLGPGDLVVGTEVGVATCLSAPLLAGGRAGSRPWTTWSAGPNGPNWPPTARCSPTWSRRRWPARPGTARWR